MLAVYQHLPAGGSKAVNIAAMERAAAAAAAIGARLITFPELCLTGYNIGRTSLHDLAERVDGPSVAAVAEMARKHAIGVIFGMPERDGQRVFNSAVAIDDLGAVTGIYRKIHLFGEAEQETFAAGEHICVAEIRGRKIGLAVCYDIEFPEMARALVRAGAEIVCVPTANMAPYFEVPQSLVRSRALENGVWVAYANLCGQEGTLHYTGLSCIVGPDGRDAARAGMDGTALVCCSTDTVALPLSTQHRDLRADALSPG